MSGYWAAQSPAAKANLRLMCHSSYRAPTWLSDVVTQVTQERGSRTNTSTIALMGLAPVPSPQLALQPGVIAWGSSLSAARKNFAAMSRWMYAYLLDGKLLYRSRGQGKRNFWRGVHTPGWCSVLRDGRWVMSLAEKSSRPGGC